jgi:hypothetical protein
MGVVVQRLTSAAVLGKETWYLMYRRLSEPRADIWHLIDLKSVYFAFRFGQCLWVYDVFIWFCLVYLFIHSVTYVTLDTSITDYNLQNIL